jgi:nucleoside-diphosphate-sugar epimerase
MPYNPYSRTNEQILDGAIAGVSLWVAFLIRYDSAIPPYREYQFWALLVPLIAGRLLTNLIFRLYRIQWRYISSGDVLRIGRAYLAFSIVLLLMRFGLPVEVGILRIPVSVIVIELLLSVIGAMGIRLLRRYIYEHQAQKTIPPKREEPRRLLLVGAGIMGANAAKEMAADSSVRIVGFLDDDPRKLGCIIAGVEVLGPTSKLAEIVRTERVDAVLVCIAPAARGSFDRLVALLDALPVTSKFIPTISEILNSKDGLHLGVGHSEAQQKGASIEVTQGRELLLQRPANIRDKRILITGGAGFIGSTLAERLADDNQVLLLDRFFHGQAVAFTSLSKHPNVSMIEADILDSAKIEQVASEVNIVIHAAAIVGVGRVCSYPRETLETNFTGTSNILRAVDKSPHLERFVYFSTSEVFGVNSFRVHEDTPTAIGPAAEARWSYAIAKLAGEHLVKAYHRQGGLPVVTVRPFNVFGPRRLGSHAILQFVLSSLMGEPIEVHGDGSQIRSWCFIEDFCDAIIEMLGRPEAVGEDFNIGNPQNTLTILQLAQQVMEVTGRSVPIKLIDSPFPDIEIRVPSLEKARQVLDYRPKYELRKGLELTAEWYRKNLDFFETKLSRAAVATHRS